jgi:N-acetylmuramoyl-L-alanine amidase
MRVLISSGHTLKGKGTGSVGYINEGTENRILSNMVVKYLKKAGHEVDYYEINEGSDYLAKQVAKANSKDYDLVVQIHFNAFKLVEGSMGTETYYISDSGKVWAEKVNDKLSTVFKSRGVKKGEGLYWLKNSKPIAILIETCFVDSKLDTDTYKVNKDLIGKLIAEAINRKEIDMPKEIFYRVIAGSFSNRENAEQQIKLLNDKGIKGVFLDIYKK